MVIEILPQHEIRQFCLYVDVYNTTSTTITAPTPNPAASRIFSGQNLVRRITDSLERRKKPKAPPCPASSCTDQFSNGLSINGEENISLPDDDGRISGMPEKERTRYPHMVRENIELPSYAQVMQGCKNREFDDINC